ncbi:hypothetical protein BKA93DRAFT_388151 [Sparassis latifolia]
MTSTQPNHDPTMAHVAPAAPQPPPPQGPPQPGVPGEFGPNLIAGLGSQQVMDLLKQLPGFKVSVRCTSLLHTIVRECVLSRSCFPHVIVGSGHVRVAASGWEPCPMRRPSCHYNPTWYTFLPTYTGNRLRQRLCLRSCGDALKSLSSDFPRPTTSPAHPTPRIPPPCRAPASAPRASGRSRPVLAPSWSAEPRPAERCRDRTARPAWRTLRRPAFGHAHPQP